MLKLIEFTYTKPDGTTSRRSIMETVTPSKNYAGIDVSSMPEVEFAEFIQEYRELINSQYEAKMALIHKHDLTHNYRQFVPERMTDITTEQI